MQIEYFEYNSLCVCALKIQVTGMARVQTIFCFLLGGRGGGGGGGSGWGKRGPEEDI